MGQVIYLSHTISFSPTDSQLSFISTSGHKGTSKSLLYYIEEKDSLRIPSLLIAIICFVKLMIVVELLQNYFFLDSQMRIETKCFCF